MVGARLAADNGSMDRLLTPPNGPRFVIIAVALIARAVLGVLPLIGGLIGFVLLLVVLYQVALIALNLIKTRPART